MMWMCGLPCKELQFILLPHARLTTLMHTVSGVVWQVQQCFEAQAEREVEMDAVPCTGGEGQFLKQFFGDKGHL